MAIELIQTMPKSLLPAPPDPPSLPAPWRPAHLARHGNSRRPILLAGGAASFPLLPPRVQRPAHLASTGATN
ncbi:hypothetical protein PAHAL_6G083400 [Panicum hallii]|uniref:Uncharacterized protein n=1 Tax=Panicum hallii TaxID=206008 RepID=A0A2T8IFT5_9POAL|nr:hypothetical protein PAHAL_6G083400 [Panicum hallii]